MKKLKVVVVAALAIILFAGCKKETQKEFTAELAEQSKMNAGEYSIALNKVSIEAENADAPTRASMEMVAKMVSGTKISGDYLKDSKKEQLEMTMDFDLLGQKIPVEFFMNEKKQELYMNTVILTEIIDIAKEFDAEIPIEAKDLERLEGKYIHVTEKDMEESTAGDTAADSISGNLDTEIFSEYLDTLAPESFEKKEDTIKRTFTKKDIQGFIKYVEENGNKDEKKTAKDLKGSLDQLTKYEQTTTLNTQKNTQKTTLKLAAKNEDVTVSANLTLNNQAKESKKKITLPKAAETVSVKELEEIFASAQEQSALVPEEDFNDLLDVIRSGQAQLTQTEIDQIKETYKPYLTDEQYKQLEEALEQSGQLSA